MPIYAFEGRRPTIAPSAYIAPSAVIIGRVTIGQQCYIGPGAILRGDYGSIEVGDQTAVEEGVIIHARPEDWTRIGRRVTLGHGAMVHNATIHDGAVIGMRAVVSDFAEVGAGALVGEMGLVKNSQKIPPRKVAVGVPVKVVGDVDERHRAMTHWAKDLYADLAGRYAAGGLVELQVQQRCEKPAEERESGKEGKLRCSECGAQVEQHEVCEVDDALICVRCMYGDVDPLAIYPIGLVKNDLQRNPTDLGVVGRDRTSKIELMQSQERFLHQLEDETFLTVVYYLHQARPVRSVFARGSDGKVVGVFATRTPDRLSRIAIQDVRLIKIEGTTLFVKGLDAIDGSPVLDLKMRWTAITE